MWLSSMRQHSFKFPVPKVPGSRLCQEGLRGIQYLTVMWSTGHEFGTSYGVEKPPSCWRATGAMVKTPHKGIKPDWLGTLLRESTIA